MCLFAKDTKVKMMKLMKHLMGKNGSERWKCSNCCLSGHLPTLKLAVRLQSSAIHRKRVIYYFRFENTSLKRMRGMNVRLKHRHESSVLIKRLFGDGRANRRVQHVFPGLVLAVVNGPDVNPQASALREILAAEEANEFPFLLVHRLHVNLQDSGVRKVLAADIADERPLVLVHRLDVSLQILLRAEPAVAHLTDEVLEVDVNSLDVLLQPVDLAEPFLAMVAAEFSLVLVNVFRMTCQAIL